MSAVDTPGAATPDGGNATPPPEQARDAATRTCPRCGAGLREDQDWCLNCGAAVTTEVRRPPNWRLPVAVVGTILLLALGALAIAFLAVADDGEVVAQATPTATPSGTPVPTPTPSPDPAGGVTPAPGEDGSAIDPAPGEDGGTIDPAPGGTTDDGDTGTDGDGTDDGVTDDGGVTGGTDPGGTGTGDSAPGSTGGSEPQSWPSGEAAWTVVLFSGESREDAEARAQELQTGGRSVGVLDSDDYETLNGGYWVVFSGQYDSRAEAESAAEGLRSSAEGAYPRFVDPR